MILTPQHMGYPHQRIINGVGEEKCRSPVGSADDKVTNIIASKGLWSSDQIIKFECLTLGDPKPQGGHKPPLQVLGDLGLA